MRDIAKASRANLGSITYHFGTKDGLLRAVYERHSGPVNRRRSELLSEAQRIRDPDDRLVAIVRAFILPSLSDQEGVEGGGARFARLRAVVMTERHEEAQKIVAETFNPINLAFIDALQLCLPRVPRRDVVWRTHFLLGAVNYTLINPWRVTRLSRGEARGEDTKEALEQIVRAAVAAFRAPASKVSARAKRSLTVGKKRQTSHS